MKTIGILVSYHNDDYLTLDLGGFNSELAYLTHRFNPCHPNLGDIGTAVFGGQAKIWPQNAGAGGRAGVLSQ